MSTVAKNMAYPRNRTCAITAPAEAQHAEPDRHQKKASHSPMMYFGLLAWGACIIAGVTILGRYQVAAGNVGEIPSEWPADVPLHRDETKFTLLMFAHPQCPCTSASIGELARLMTHSNDQLSARVLFICPTSMPKAWERGENWSHASTIPGVDVLCDSDGRWARSFGVKTSGQILLYGPKGKLMFQGGITASRGHFGDNAGADSILAILSGQPAPTETTPVFGCPLFDS